MFTQSKLPFEIARVPRWESLNERLRDALMTMSASVPDKGSNMPNGRSFFENKWLSPTGLHLHGPPVFQELGTVIESVANKLAGTASGGRLLHITSMWSIISRSDMEGRRHDHKGVMSVAYYVDAEMCGDRNGGLLQFFTDRNSATPSHVVTPRSGDLVTFPSSLAHSVSRYSGDAPRIVVSANLK